MKNPFETAHPFFNDTSKVVTEFAGILIISAKMGVFIC